MILSILAKISLCHQVAALPKCLEGGISFHFMWYKRGKNSPTWLITSNPEKCYSLYHSHPPEWIINSLGGTENTLGFKNLTCHPPMASIINANISGAQKYPGFKINLIKKEKHHQHFGGYFPVENRANPNSLYWNDSSLSVRLDPIIVQNKADTGSSLFLCFFSHVLKKQRKEKRESIYGMWI